MHEKVGFIAELDEAGDVVWVWVADTPISRARPVRDLARERLRLTDGVCHGAPAEMIARWFDSRLGSA